MDKIVNVIREAVSTGKKGDGEIFVYTIDKAIQIGTGDRGKVTL